MWLLVHDYKLPQGYSPASVSMAIKIPANYPDAEIDMVYFHPAIKRLDGKAIPCTECIQPIDGKDFQRWSRHYTIQNPWVSGVCSLESHYYTIGTWLDREFKRNP